MADDDDNPFFVMEFLGTVILQFLCLCLKRIILRTWHYHAKSLDSRLHEGDKLEQDYTVVPGSGSCSSRPWSKHSSAPCSSRLSAARGTPPSFHELIGWGDNNNNEETCEEITAIWVRNPLKVTAGHAAAAINLFIQRRWVPWVAPGSSF